jgi:hypothetical protein
MPNRTPASSLASTEKGGDLIFSPKMTSGFLSFTPAL